MNLLNKNICIIGFNQALGPELVKNLAKYKVNISIITFPADNVEYYMVKNPFNRVRIYKTTHRDALNFINTADIIINISLCPTLANLTKHWGTKIGFNKNILANINKNKRIIHISPLVSKSLFSPFTKNIFQIEKLTSDNKKSTIIKVPPIISYWDALNVDIYNSIHFHNFHTNYGHKAISVVASQDIVKHTIDNILSTEIISSYELGLTKQISIEELTKSVIYNEEIIAHLKKYPKVLTRIFNVLFKLKLNSLRGKFLTFLHHSKKVTPNEYNQTLTTFATMMKLYSPYHFYPFYSYEQYMAKK